MLRFIYVTDLHGWVPGYEATLELACGIGVDLIVNGGDILPKGKSLEGSLAEAAGMEGVPPIFGIQSNFLKGYLAGYFERCNAQDVRYLTMFGNDDLGCHWNAWCELVDRYEHVKELSTAWHELSPGVSFRGCPYVPDVPFRLKDWVLRDDDEFTSPPQLAQAVVSKPNGVEPIEDLARFLSSRPTLEEHLDDIAGEIHSGDFQRAVFVGHSPPAKTGLALIGDGTDVGSLATTRWIEKYQPLLTLHGHIHESPDVSGEHMVSVGRSICHNPGQAAPDFVTASVITIDQDSVEIERILLPPRDENR